MSFAVDNRILVTSMWLYDSYLSSVFIKNDANFPWFILVPRVENVEEIYQLSTEDQHMLMREVTRFSRIMNGGCQPHKLNVGALGNIVSQLHVHIVARFKEDSAWPHGVWQPLVLSVPYETMKLNEVVSFWQKQIRSIVCNDEL